MILPLFPVSSELTADTEKPKVTGCAVVEMSPAPRTRMVVLIKRYLIESRPWWLLPHLGGTTVSIKSVEGIDRGNAMIDYEADDSGQKAGH